MRNVELPGQFADFDLVVRPAANENDNRPLSLPDSLREQLSKVEGVKQVVGCEIDLIPIEPGAVMVLGLPPDAPQLKRLRILTGGRALTAEDRNNVIIGRDLARRLDKKEGDELQLGNARFQIVGIYFSHSTLENSSIIAPLWWVHKTSTGEANPFEPDPRQLSGNLTAFGIIADPSLDAEGLKSLRKRLAAVQPGLEARTAKTRDKDAPAEKPSAEKGE